MQTPSYLLPRLALAPALALAVAACGNGGGTGLDRLTPEQVSGTYEICSLVFTPQQTLLPPVDLRASAIDMSPQAALRASLLVRTEPTLTLRYTTPPPSGDIVQHAGTYQLGTSTVTVSFTGTGAQRGALLLPNRLDLEFTEPPKQLTTLATPATYAVPRADYARLAGVDEAGLADPISGTLSARFVVGACP